MREAASPPPRGFLQRLGSWFTFTRDHPDANDRVDWFRAIPFLLLHLACLGVFWVGISPIAVGVCLFLYALRVFTLTAFYHRYFSHRAFKTSRPVQFVFAVIGCSAAQRNPLWWAAHHRHHHVHSDDGADLHSPRQRGFWWSHLFWFLTPHALKTNMKMIPDYARYPELRLLCRLEMVIPVALAVGLFFFGSWLGTAHPDLGTNGWQMLVWGFFVSTILVYHVTYLVNSATHIFGRRRFATKDDSRNSLWVALLTFGEGWHNNHHHYPNSARQGFYWWEIDISYSILKLMSVFGLVWDLHPVPKHALKKNLVRSAKKSLPAPTKPAADAAVPAPQPAPAVDSAAEAKVSV